VLAIVRGGQLCALVGTLFVILIRPVWRSPSSLVHWERCVQDVSSFLAAPSDGEIPDLDGSIHASTEQVLTVWVRVDGSADALVVSCNLLLGSLVMAEIPALNGSIVSAEGELDGVSRGPLDVANTAIHASVVISAATDCNVSTHVAQVPQTDGVVMAGRQQQMALVGVEGEFVYLTRMLVQPGELDACAVQVVQYDFAICSGRGDVGAELAMGPFHVVYAQALALSGMGIGIIEDGSTQVGLVDNLGILDADCF
jgi:hypothetical protein